MVDRGRAQDLNEAANRFAESLADSYRLVYGRQHSRQSASSNVPRNSRSSFRAISGSKPRPAAQRPATLRAGTKAGGRPTRSSSTPPSPATGRAPSKPPKVPRRGCAPSLRRPQDCWAPPPER